MHIILSLIDICIRLTSCSIKELRSLYEFEQFFANHNNCLDKKKPKVNASDKEEKVVELSHITSYSFIIWLINFTYLIHI